MTGRLARLSPLLLLAWLQGALADTCPPWVLWQNFQKHLISEDGRVIDYHSPALHSTSEGQAYALFMALVNNDRERFDQLLRWTENNLAQGDLHARLPAWQWGRKEDKSWGVLDANSASDADLWLAYSLAEAGRLWSRPHLTTLAKSLTKRILAEESARLPGLGRMLLPGPRGFAMQDGRWRLNPSYLPLQLLRYMEQLLPEMGWQEILDNTLTLLQAHRLGLISDWILYDKQHRFLADTTHGNRGSYDAIRVYLWAGMLHPEEPARATVLNLLAPMARLIEELGAPPRSIDTKTGRADAPGPPGFSAALLPLLQSLHHPRLMAQLQSQARSVLQHPDHYYDQVLALFALGWVEGRYRFDRHGYLLPRWTSPCTTASHS